jgi:two-component system, chemotaxis family, response regulator Rcp1
MFRILVVDDNPAAAHLLQELMKYLQRPHEVHFARDGVEALDFLHCRGEYRDAQRPNLILLDMNMPRLSGLETLSAIKYDPDLCVIPVIMLSSTNSPQEVRRSYQAHANCYVQKPVDLERSVKLVQAVEAFWMDFALLPSCEGRPDNLQGRDFKGEHPVWYAQRIAEASSGPKIAAELREVSSRAMRRVDSPDKETATPSRSSGCEEHNRLLDEFGGAVREILKLHEEQFLAIVEGDPDCHRFDLLIHMANEKKQLAKYGYLRHVEAHGCTNTNALNQTRA